MVRVLATIQNSQYDGKFKSQKKSLTTWANEIHQGYYSLVVSPIISAIPLFSVHN